MGVKFKSFVNETIKVGYLQVNVFRYILRMPLQGALARVSKLTIGGLYREKGYGAYIETKESDENGSVKIFTLPVIQNEDAIYILSVQATGYHTAYVMGVPIYPGITTTYDIFLRHHTFIGSPDYEFLLQPHLPGHEHSPSIF